MPPGKLAAQVAHAAMSFMSRGLKRSSIIEDPWASNWFVSGFTSEFESQHRKQEVVEERTLEVDEELALWLDGAFTKIVVSVPDEETLLAVYNAAGIYKCRRSLIQDAGRTVFNGVPTHTCVAVGPNFIEKVDAVTKYLPLYR